MRQVTLFINESFYTWHIAGLNWIRDIAFDRTSSTMTFFVEDESFVGDEELRYLVRRNLGELGLGNVTPDFVAVEQEFL